MSDVPRVLDAGSYPHIMDEILSCLPLDQLIPLRQLSRAVRIRVDALITCYCVELHDHRWKCMEHCSPPYAVVRCTHHSRPDRRQYCVQNLPLPRTLVKVLHYKGGSDKQLVEIINSFGTIHTIQRSHINALFGNFPRTDLDANIITLVDYLDTHKLGAATIDRHSEWFHEVVVPKTIRRHVLHVAFNQLRGPDGDHDMLHDVRSQLPPTVRDSVLVFWPHFSISPNSGPKGRRAYRRPFVDLPQTVHSLLRTAAVTAAVRGNTTTTIVGADRLSPLLFSQNRAGMDNREEVVNEVKKLIRTALAKEVGKSEHKLEKAMDNIRFLTLEEWWEELGPFRRRYEGLALGAERADEQEEYSLKLIEL